jgi:hypothetical protein
VACPSPPGQVLLQLATFFSFRWSFPLLAGLVGCVVMVWEPWCSSGYCLWPSGECCLSPPSADHCFLLLTLLGCCGGDNTTLSQSDWAACELPAWLNLPDLIHSTTLTWVTRAWLWYYGQILCLIIILLNEENGTILCQILRVNNLTLTYISIFFLFLFVLQVINLEDLDGEDDPRPSLGIVSYSCILL